MEAVSFSRRQWLVAAGAVAITSIGPTRGGFAEQLDGSGKDLIFRTIDPRNAEPELSKLVQSWITPVKHFYVRSHAPNPMIDRDHYQLTVEGLVRNPLTLTFADLDQMPRHSVTATLTCAGNRRAEFNQEGEVGGVQWEAGAIGNARWSGVALSDVLNRAEVLENAKHVWFEGLDEIERDDGVIPFGGSIPLEKAMEDGKVPGALLADQMNGRDLSPDHGYPLRSVVPGYIGARSVKWLGKIFISDKPSPNHYLETAYKIVTNTEPIDWSESGPIYRYPINGAIAMPAANAQVQPGMIDVSGYVLPTGRAGATVQRVLISADDGVNWQEAKLTGEVSEYCWQLWNARIAVTAQTDKLLMRATDTSGGFMPQRVEWNAKGYLQNSWYKVPIKVS